jgi:hypothetical protein
MFSTLRTRFGIPGVISVMALVFAMLGGAYAANSPSGGGKATASAKAKKGPRARPVRLAPKARPAPTARTAPLDPTVLLVLTANPSPPPPSSSEATNAPLKPAG